MKGIGPAIPRPSKSLVSVSSVRRVYWVRWKWGGRGEGGGQIEEIRLLWVVLARVG